MNHLSNIILAGARRRVLALAALAALQVVPTTGTAADSDQRADGRRQFLAAYAAAESSAPGAVATDSDTLRA